MGNFILQGFGPAGASGGATAGIDTTFGFGFQQYSDGTSHFKLHPSQPYHMIGGNGTIHRSDNAPVGGTRTYSVNGGTRTDTFDTDGFLISSTFTAS